MHRKKSVFGIQAAATIIGMIVLGTLLLFWAYLLPTGRMKSHIAESDETFNYEGIYPMIIHGYKCTQLDNYTDGLMYTTAIYPGSGDTLRDMLENPRIEYDDANMVQGMNDYANDVKERESHQYEITYGRYWHGYLVVLKTLLLFFNVSEIRMINLFLQGTLFCILLYLVRKRMEAVYQIPLLLMEAVLNPIVLPLSLQYSWVYYVGILSAMVFLIKEKWHAESIFLLFLITGMVTSYVDLLTYPLITLGLPMMVFLLRWQENDGTWRKKLLYFMGNSMFWGIGYALMWGSKWILNSIFTNGNIFEKCPDRNRNQVVQYRRSAGNLYSRNGVAEKLGCYKSVSVSVGAGCFCSLCCAQMHCACASGEANDKKGWKNQLQPVMEYVTVAGAFCPTACLDCCYGESFLGALLVYIQRVVCNGIGVELFPVAVVAEYEKMRYDGQR